jgi:hypothetical protein
MAQMASMVSTLMWDAYREDDLKPFKMYLWRP